MIIIRLIYKLYVSVGSFSFSFFWWGYFILFLCRRARMWTEFCGRERENRDAHVFRVAVDMDIYG